jgi:hypothetical protein
MEETMFTKKKSILIIFILFCMAFLGLNVYRISLNFECYMRQKSIGSYFLVYLHDHEDRNPATLDELALYFDDFPKENMQCPTTKDKYLYFSNTNSDNDIIIADSVDCHRIGRSGLLGVFDFFTLNFFAPKGRNIIYRDGTEGSLSEIEFENRIKEQR